MGRHLTDIAVVVFFIEKKPAGVAGNIQRLPYLSRHALGFRELNLATTC